MVPNHQKTDEVIADIVANGGVLGVEHAPLVALSTSLEKAVRLLLDAQYQGSWKQGEEATRFALGVLALNNGEGE